MLGQLQRGSRLTSDSGIVYTVQDYIGSGGQGEVYKVSNGNNYFALKLYFRHTATVQQKEILHKLIRAGKLSENFLWPEEFIDFPNEKTFGYIMKLRPPEFKSIVDWMKRKIEPNFSNLCRACFNLTKEYQTLHRAGYKYVDISLKNIFFNPADGKVLICDNDNVVPNNIVPNEKNIIGVSGTPGFRAPEIVRGEAMPSRNTDLYSLSVLLFHMLMINHPLEGRQEANIKCMDAPARKKIYGTNPIFIWDPHNDSNRPVAGYQDNAIIFWKIYPEYIRKLFTRAFTVGLKEPNKRVTEKEWLDAFANLIVNVMNCQHCGAENFFDSNRLVAHCWNCNRPMIIPSKLVIENKKILIREGTKIFSHYLYDDYDINTVVAEVVRNPKNPQIFGLRNLSNTNWTYIRQDNSMTVVERGKSAKIAGGVEIVFGNRNGHFE